jgi:CBS domain-containing protein
LKLKNDSINQVVKKTTVVTPRTSLLDARAILLKHRINRLIVSEKDKLVGMLTEKDLVKTIYRIDAKPLESTCVSDVMSKDLCYSPRGGDII